MKSSGILVLADCQLRFMLSQSCNNTMPVRCSDIADSLNVKPGVSTDGRAPTGVVDSARLSWIWTGSRSSFFCKSGKIWDVKLSIVWVLRSMFVKEERTIGPWDAYCVTPSWICDKATMIWSTFCSTFKMRWLAPSTETAVDFVRLTKSEVRLIWASEVSLVDRRLA